MPIYEYRCGKCGFQKEFLQRLSDAPLTQCPECGKRALSKMVTAAGFQLKGTGWYATDFKSSGAKPEAKADKAVKTDKADAKQDKPAAAEKPAASSGKEASKPAPAAAEAPAARAADASTN
jgi:putative FmdB family regulatory protein